MSKMAAKLDNSGLMLIPNNAMTVELHISGVYGTFIAMDGGLAVEGLIGPTLGADTRRDRPTNDHSRRCPPER